MGENGAEEDDFQWVVGELASEFAGVVDYSVVAGVAVDVWAEYRRRAGRRWTARHVFDTARAQLRRSVARRPAMRETTAVGS